MSQAWVAFAAEYLQVGVLDGFRSCVVSDLQPGFLGLGHRGNECLPGFHQTLPKNKCTPLVAALLDLCGCEKQCRLGTRHILCAAHFRHVGRPD